jgi:hypothetical protein
VYVKPIAILCVVLTACAGTPRATVRGADLYAHAAEIRERGRASVPGSTAMVVVRRDQYLVDRSTDQVFVVRDVISGCAIDDEADCTLALLRDQKFVVVDEPPTPRGVHEEGSDMSALNKARVVSAATTALLAYGAAKCDAFDGCGTLLGIGAGLDGLVLLLLMLGPDLHD